MRFLMQLPSRAAIALVRLYQMTLSHLIGNECRFHPSCSHYMILAIRKYGVARGIPKGVWRICRCHPWHPGGVDFP